MNASQEHRLDGRRSCCIVFPRTHDEPRVRSWERHIVGNVADQHVIKPTPDHERWNLDFLSGNAGLLPKGIVEWMGGPGRVLLRSCRAPIVLHSLCRRLAYVVRDPPRVEVPHVSILESELWGDRDQVRRTSCSRLQRGYPTVARSLLPD